MGMILSWMRCGMPARLVTMPPAAICIGNLRSGASTSRSGRVAQVAAANRKAAVNGTLLVFEYAPLAALT